MVSVLQNQKFISLEFVASSSQRQDLLEAKLDFVASNQEAMGNKMEVMSSRQDTMGASLRAVLELMKYKP